MNKILRTLYLVPLSFILTGCWTSIFTVAPTVEPVAPPKTVYTTQVTTPSPKVTTVTTVTVTNYNDDLPEIFFSFSILDALQFGTVF